MSTVPNPWLELRDAAPYVLTEDAPAVAAYNRLAGDAHRLRLHLLPEPYLGRPDARVLLLSRNPGYDPGDDAVHLQPAFVAASRANLVHAPADHPFYLLSPKFLHAPGAQYWRSKLRPLAAGVAAESGVVGPEDAWRIVARNVSCVEYFPYHSRRYRSMPALLPSQAYSFALVKEALKRGAVVVGLRGVSDWTAAVPELSGYSGFFLLNSAQNVTVSERNCPAGFARIIQAAVGVR